MDTKKWPILAQILIGLGVIGGLVNMAAGLSQKNIPVIIVGIIGLVIYWSFYRLKKWALIAMNILLSLNILMALFNIGRIPNLILFAIIIYPALVLFYFNSPKIRGLFRQTEENKETNPTA